MSPLFQSPGNASGASPRLAAAKEIYHFLSIVICYRIRCVNFCDGFVLIVWSMEITSAGAVDFGPRDGPLVHVPDDQWVIDRACEEMEKEP
jgi:nitrate reductase NapE component